jgi:ABC-type amino acid transport substrate-binding protein
MSEQLDHLDALALRVAKGDESTLGVLSRGEYLYVVLAANRPDLLAAGNDTIAEALARLGEDWTAQLVERWQYKGDPTKR